MKLEEMASTRIREMLTAREMRKQLNKEYLRLNPQEKNRFHQKFSKIFRNEEFNGPNGVWEVDFYGKKILMPLTKERMWLDWDTAISIIGHDIEVKQTYEALIALPKPPDLFIDIGANYGTHSLLFLVHQIDTITFEPNASCHPFFKEMCELNGVVPQLEAVALGETAGYAELSYPERRTWYGSTKAEVAEGLSSNHELVTETVGQKTLDEYFPQIGQGKTVIKIDTEGNELAVLRGAAQTLDEVKPVIIFESFSDSGRAELLGFLEDNDYKIYDAPWKPENKSPLESDQFLASTSSNFIAITHGAAWEE